MDEMFLYKCTDSQLASSEEAGEEQVYGWKAENAYWWFYARDNDSLGRLRPPNERP